MKHLVHILFLFSFCNGLIAQKQNVEQLIEQARAIKFTYPDSAIQLANKALKKIANNNSIFAECKLYNVLGLANFAKGNLRAADSLLAISLIKAKVVKNDTMQIILNNNLGIMHRDYDSKENCLHYHKTALAIAKKTKRLFDIADTYNNIGAIYNLNNNSDSALYYMDLAMVTYKSSMKDNKYAEIGYADVATNQGLIYTSEGKFTLAYLNLFKALKIFEKHKLWDKATIAAYDIGEIYFEKNDLKKALQYCRLSLSFEKLSPNQLQRAYNLFCLGKIYNESGDLDTALIYYSLSENIHRTHGMTNLLPPVLNSKATALFQQGNYKQALESVGEALKINEAGNDTSGICVNYSCIASLYIKKGNYAEAEKYIQKALKMIKPKMYFALYCEIYEQAAVISGKLGKFKSAYEYLSHFNLYNDSLRNNNDKRQQEEISEIYQSEKKEQELKLAKTENEKKTLALDKSEEAGKRKSLQLYMALIGGILLLVLVGFMIRSNIIRKRTNKMLAEKNKIIYEQHTEVIHQKLLVEEKNKEITDSINYARRIQLGILPSSEEITQSFPNHFVLYHPKDIVSGDFYWCKKLENGNLIAAVDCTGHGVPGGFMSMLGNTLLNQSIKETELTTPARALDYVNRELPHNLKSHDKEMNIRDGMDIALCRIDEKNKKLMYSGANNPLWIVRNKQCIELKPDKQPITASTDAEKLPFTHNTFDLQTNDMVYLFTDGYADQFGGPKGKKFKYSNLQKFLCALSKLDLKLQHKQLEEEFFTWRGDLEQLDDVLIIGIRIS